MALTENDIKEIEGIYKNHTGTNMELEYIPTPKKNVLAAMQEYADLKVAQERQRVSKLVEALEDAHKALQELAYLKSVKDFPSHKEDYERRRPLAWSNAKKVLPKIQQLIEQFKNT